MALWSEAWRDLQERPHWVYLFLGAVLLLDAPETVLTHYLSDSLDPEAPASWAPLYRMASDIYLAFGYAAIYAVCFAMLGREIDRPLWRCETIADALTRFFIPWLIVVLIEIAVYRGQVYAATAGAGELVMFLGMVDMILTLTLPLVIVAVMHYGHFEFKELGDAVRPLLRFPMLAMQASLIFLMQYVLFWTIAFSQSTSDGLSPLFLIALNIPFSFLDVFGFAAVWRICMHYRDTAHDDDEDPFDF